MKILTSLGGVCFVLLLLSSCATTAKYEAVLESYLGASEEQLIANWGPPDSVYDSNGQKYLTYFYESSVYIPGSSPTYETNYYGNTAYTTSYGGSPGHTIDYRCKTTFTVNSSGIIAAYRYQGNGCKSK